ncbi:MAG: hypothetical protein ABI758_01080 [Candidatus Woesebacteria bacterium]
MTKELGQIEIELFSTRSEKRDKRGRAQARARSRLRREYRGGRIALDNLNMDIENTQTMESREGRNVYRE